MPDATEIDRLLDEFRREADGISSRAAYEALKGRYVNREHGLVPALFERLKSLAGPEKADFGKRANAAKREIEAALEACESRVRAGEAAARAARDEIDVTLPGRAVPIGAWHPLTVVRRQIEAVFARLGFSIADGPELETDFFNFGALNFPPEHPARDTQDTLLVSTARDGGGPPEYLLRTHTSPVQIRALTAHGAPIRIVCPGRVYRKDEVDATHSPVFHQIEGLVVDRGITMAHLKGTIQAFLQGLFGRETKVRFTCSYFPFVEPGAQAAMTCFLCRGAGCRTCKGSGWIEILGAGMVHPSVLRVCGVDPEVYSGFAFGTGVDRLAFLKFGVPDLRLFFENDLRFLSQFRSAG
ncbi:MAG TPA: phenylalanine--tRNA ligase subunit alpha [Thermoanaerobaculia bacterium]|nr:phenylalanine--tRNA ligase subunit alpha [Thermoanaerobaculia bacterium]